MKTFSFPRHGRSVVFACLAFACFSMFAPAVRAEDGRLLIRRAANFGSYTWLEIWIDGQNVEKGIALGHDFSTSLSPGHHVIGVRGRPPQPFSDYLTSVPLNVHSGRTYTFTAFWRKDRAVLEPSQIRSR